MNRLLIGLLGAAVIGTGGYAAASGLETDPARTVSLPAATSTDETTTTTAATTEATTTGAATTDVSGPCDEAEHRNDPRCTGAALPPATAPATSGTTTVGDDGPGDISGPCDEAEHRNDPRCTGTAAADDDSSGRGRNGDDRDDEDDRGGDEDRSGSNSGKG